MAINRKYLFLLVCGFLLSGCSSVQHISKTDVRYESVSARSGLASEESITAIIAPYKEKLDVLMNEVIGNVAEEMTKKKPESTLGNWYTDAMLSGAKKNGYKVDFAISNYGGLRIPYLSAGPLTRGEIYELCPFDNLLVIVDVPGNILDSLMQQIAAAEGWPVSEGMRMVIKNNKLETYSINGIGVSSSGVYSVAMPDYIANGGDGLKMLIELPRVQSGILIRDMLIDYARETTQNGRAIRASIEGRIVNQQ